MTVEFFALVQKKLHMDFRRGPLEIVLNFQILLIWPGFKILVLLTLGGAGRLSTFGDSLDF